jgi:dienelactone hydrolase
MEECAHPVSRLRLQPREAEAERRGYRAMNKRVLGDRTTRRVKSQPLSDLDAARSWTAERKDCTARIGVIGFRQAAATP